MMDLRTSRLKREISDDSGTVAKRKKCAEPESQPEGLARLPEEVLLIILDVLLDNLVRCSTLGDVLQHVKMIHSLCLTDSKFNRLATPYLCTFVNNRNRRKVPQALDAMILDSKKSEGIKYMSWALDVKRSSQAMCRRSLKAETMFLQKLGRLGIPELAGDLRQCFHGNSSEYHLATALVLAPNLVYLEAADVNYVQATLDDATWRPTWLELLSLKALSSPPGLSQHFQHLRHLRLDMGELTFEQIGPLLLLPALRILHLVGGQHSGEIPAHPWDEEVGKRRSTIETLIFEYGSVSSTIVAQIMDAIEHLKVLKLEMDYWSSPGNEDDEEPDTLQLSPSILSTAIAKHKESLERLYLIKRDTDSWGTLEGERKFDAMEKSHMGCLRDMHKLSYLDTGLRSIQTHPFTLFLDTPLSSLKHLVIQVEEEWSYMTDYFQRAMQDLATDCRSRLPLLRDVVVWLPQKDDGFPWHIEPDFSASKAAFKDQGVDIVILVYSHDHKRWQLHPCTVEESSLPINGSWECRLHNAISDPLPQDGRDRVLFHGPCSAYHHPHGWSIIDNFADKRS